MHIELVITSEMSRFEQKHHLWLHNDSFSRVSVGLWSCAEGNCRCCVGREVVGWNLMTHGSVSFAWPSVRMITNNTKAFPPRTAVVSAVDGGEKKKASSSTGYFFNQLRPHGPCARFFHSFYQQLKNNNRKAVVKTM